MTDDPTDDPGELRLDERQRQAATLRIAGVGYATIATQLGYANASGAWKAAEAGIAALMGDPDSVTRLLELQRLDEMLVGLWRKARSGDTFAVDRVLKIMERRARYLGLDPSAEAPAPSTRGESELERASARRAQRRSRPTA